MESLSALTKAHRELTEHGNKFGITSMDAIKETFYGSSFLLSDVDRNWWEIAWLKN